jgi:hypothetical protein
MRDGYVALHKKLDRGSPRGQFEVMENSRILLEAIATRRCVEAVYNRTAMRLAPHILYTRHDELYVDAVALVRDGQPPRELKLGTFKLAGLKEVAVGEQPFERQALFNPSEPKYAGVTLFAVEG